jgi:hypothetical protein
MVARLLRPVTRGFRNALPAIGLLGAVPSCHRSTPSPSPSSSASARAVEGPLPLAPRELLAEGVLGKPAETWKRVRAILGGPALRLPSTLPLAVTTLIGASPLVAGLVDDTAPVALTVLYDEGKPALVTGLRLTSGPELVAALANGADARFEAEVDQENGLTLLRLKHSAAGAPPGAAPGDVALGVAKHLLLLAGAERQIRIAAAYIVRSLAPSLQNTDGLTLVAGKGALVGPFSSMLQDGFRGALGGLQAAARTSREAHGRDADFGEPEAVIGALAKLADEMTGVLGSASAAKLSAALLGPVPEMSIEVVPESVGAARDLVRTLTVGDLLPLGRLPPDTDVALAWRRGPSEGEDAGIPGWSAVLGQRLRPADRKRIAAWMEDVGRATGSFVTGGLLSEGGVPTLFVLSPRGDALAGRRALEAVPTLLRQIPALAHPMDAFVGPLGITTGSREIEGIGPATEVRFRRAARSAAPRPDAEGVAIDLALSSHDGAMAMTAGGAGAALRLGELLTPVPALGIGRDAVVARAVNGAGKDAAFAGFARFRDESGPRGWAAVTVGSDRRVLRLALTASDVAAKALIRAGLAP